MGEHIRIVTDVTEKLQAKAIGLRQKLEEEKSSLQKARAAFRDQDAKTRNQRVRLEQRIAHLTRQKNALQGKLKSQHRRFQSALSTAQEREREERRLRQRLSDLAKRLDATKQRNAKLASELEVQQNERREVATLRATLSILRKKLHRRTNLEGQLQKLQSQFTALKQERDDLMVQARQDQERQRLEIQAMFRGEVTRAKKAEQAAIDEAKKLRSQHQQLNTEVARLRKHSTQLIELRTSNRKLQNELATLSSRRDRDSAQHRQLKNQAANMKALHDRCVADAETFRRASNQRVSELEDVVTRLTARHQRFFTEAPSQKAALVTAAMPKSRTTKLEKTSKGLPQQSPEVKLRLIDGSFTVTGQLVRYVGTHYFVTSSRLGSIKLDARRFRCISGRCPKPLIGEP